jgi:5-methylcytosine-specific restriction endonuclease McrA
MNDWYDLSGDKAHIARERKRAQELKHSQWWKNILAKGLCQYCGKRFSPKELTMDHIVAVARGGTSTKGNVVPACHSCNQSKKLSTPVEEALKKIADERKEEE